ncbi:MAG: hypothetical protein QOI73_2979 [Solirubrobacteraceae bacterium]|nr:hypothetical protein [Solirubrobacteraceae bacterium]
MISYAQNREDVVLARALPGGSGFYVDVGAASPVHHSVTKHFYDAGWCGINIEPLAAWHVELRAQRPRDVNLQIGCSDREGTLELFDVSQTAMEESTFSPEAATELRERGLEPQIREVPVTTLAAICREHAPQTIDFLKVDVEGWELPVLRGADWRRWRPRIVVVEATRAGSKSEGSASVARFMAEVGYERALFDGLNCFFAEREDVELRDRLSVPANVYDDYEIAETVEALERVEELERELAAAAPRLAQLKQRLELAQVGMAAARREALDAELQARTAREALERQLAE